MIHAGESFINPGGHTWDSGAPYVLMARFGVLGAGGYSIAMFVRIQTVTRPLRNESRITRANCGVFPVVVALGAAVGQAPCVDAEPPREPPSIHTVRYTENYSYLRDADIDARDQLWPWYSLKYIPLDETGEVYLTLGSEFRLRYERYEDNNWGEGPQDKDGYLWERVLPLADLHVGEHFRFFGQLISAFAFDLDQPESPVDEDRLDVIQLFVDGRLPLGNENTAATLRPGRQLLTQAGEFDDRTEDAESAKGTGSHRMPKLPAGGLHEGGLVVQIPNVVEVETEGRLGHRLEGPVEGPQRVLDRPSIERVEPPTLRLEERFSGVETNSGNGRISVRGLEHRLHLRGASTEPALCPQGRRDKRRSRPE